MVFTDEMIRRASEEREREKEINRLMICRANYSSGVPNGIVFAECQNEDLKPCDTCPVRAKWNKVRDGYMEEGFDSNEATWLTHQFFDIPTAYMCNGKMRESEKKYFPERYQKALKRQNELLNGIVEKSEPKVRESEQKQMTIFDYLGT